MTYLPESIENLKQIGGKNIPSPQEYTIKIWLRSCKDAINKAYELYNQGEKDVNKHPRYFEKSLIEFTRAANIMKQIITHPDFERFKADQPSPDWGDYENLKKDISSAKNFKPLLEQTLVKSQARWTEMYGTPRPAAASEARPAGEPGGQPSAPASSSGPSTTHDNKRDLEARLAALRTSGPSSSGTLRREIEYTPSAGAHIIGNTVSLMNGDLDDPPAPRVADAAQKKLNRSAAILYPKNLANTSSSPPQRYSQPVRRPPQAFQRGQQQTPPTYPPDTPPGPAVSHGNGSGSAGTNLYIHAPEFVPRSSFPASSPAQTYPQQPQQPSFNGGGPVQRVASPPQQPHPGSPAFSAFGNYGYREQPPYMGQPGYANPSTYSQPGYPAPTGYPNQPSYSQPGFSGHPAPPYPSPSAYAAPPIPYTNGVNGVNSSNGYAPSHPPLGARSPSYPNGLNNGAPAGITRPAPVQPAREKVVDAPASLRQLSSGRVNTYGREQAGEEDTQSAQASNGAVRVNGASLHGTPSSHPYGDRSPQPHGTPSPQPPGASSVPSPQLHASTSSAPSPQPSASATPAPPKPVTWSSVASTGGPPTVMSMTRGATAGALAKKKSRQNYAAFIRSLCEDLDSPIGLTGLKNLGNTCYMNSVIQCLSASVVFARYFKDGYYKNDINVTNPLGTKGALARAVAELITALWRQEYVFLSPITFRENVCRVAPQFSGYDQHDAQEFLGFLLDGLHEDLNLVIQKPPPVEMSPAREQDLETLPQQVMSEREWDIYQMRSDSFVVQVFQGQFRNQLKCLTCYKTSTTYNTFMPLSVPIPPARGLSRVTLEDCIEAFVREEILEKDDAWHCPRCKTNRRASKKLTLSRLPVILVIHLKRFSFRGNNHIDKLETRVAYPLSGLDLTNYLPSPLFDANMRPLTSPPKGYVYDLFAVTNHYGTLKSGHYTAYVRSQNTWDHIGDSKVETVPKEEVAGVSCTASGLLY